MYLGHKAVAELRESVFCRGKVVPALGMLQGIRDNSTQSPGVHCDLTRWTLSGVRSSQTGFSLRL